MKTGSILKIVLGANTGLLQRVTHYLAVDKIEHIRRRALAVHQNYEEDDVTMDEVFDIVMESGKEIRVESKHDQVAFDQVEEALGWLMEPEVVQTGRTDLTLG